MTEYREAAAVVLPLAAIRRHRVALEALLSLA
jgi:hypothetical protein